ncbi:MAG: CoF synthetase [Pseudomonadota bacterium]
MTDLWPVAKSMVATRWRTRSGRGRAAFLAWQRASVAKWLHRDVPKVGFYDGKARRLSDLPVIDKSIVMDHFEAFNRAQITAAQGWDIFGQGGTYGRLSIGASTGTSGNRGLYVITPEERARWLGVILAKALPRFPLRSERVAVILPQSSALYDTAAQSRRLELGFFDLRQGVGAWLDRLIAFDPTCIVAPPRILRVLAGHRASLSPRILYSGAETLDPIDRAVIEKAFERPLGQIYMATEGLLGVTCGHGTMHLAEDAVHFEFEAAGDGLVTPMISTFQRQFQIMARYRMNDLLRLEISPCPCGSPLQGVSEIVGRMDDVFVFEGGVQVTPDVLRNAVLDADRAISDFRVRRTGPFHVDLILPNAASHDQLDRAASALRKTLAIGAPRITVSAARQELPLDVTRKLRRVENCWTPGAP